MLQVFNLRKLALSLHILLLLCFCATEVLGQVKDVDTFVSYDLNKKHCKIKLTNLIQEVELIRLEETAESLLSKVNDVHLVGDKVWEVSHKIGPRYIIASSLYGKSGRLRLEQVIDRRNSEVIIIDLNRSFNKGIFDLQIPHWESDDTFYAFLPSLDL